MSNYFNEAGEPLMDGAAMRYEMYLDSTYEPEPDYFLTYDVYREEIDPEDCDHGDFSYSRERWSATCDGCGSDGILLVAFSWEHQDAPDTQVAWQV